VNFDAVFTDRFKNERHMWRYKLYAPHLITVAALPCESQNTENVIVQRDIIKENTITCVIRSVVPAIHCRIPVQRIERVSRINGRQIITVISGVGGPKFTKFYTR